MSAPSFRSRSVRPRRKRFTLTLEGLEPRDCPAVLMHLGDFPGVAVWTDMGDLSADPFTATEWAAASPIPRLPHLADAGERNLKASALVTDAAVAHTNLPSQGNRSSVQAPDPGHALLLLANAFVARPASTGQNGSTAGPGQTPPAPPGFTESIWFRDTTNLDQATGMGWAPDGSNRLFVMQKTGEVRVIQDGQLVAAPFATIRPIYTESECGLIGMAFDPNYVVNRQVYFFVTVSDREQQVLRYTDVDNVGTDKTVILANLPTLGVNHDGGGLGFGLDGKLYFAVGDIGNYIGGNEDLKVLASKVGRANPDGSIPEDNPFHDGDGPNNDYIWARGFRNPYTLTFQPGTGQLWLNVVGKAYEQIFVVNAADHGGWYDYENNQPEGFLPPVIKYATNMTDVRGIPANGAVRSNGVTTFTTADAHGFRRGERITIAGVANNSFNGTFPVLDVTGPNTFRVAQAGANATSGGGTATTQHYGGAVLGGTFYNGTQFPAEYWGNFFFGDFNSGNLFRTVLDEQNTVALVEPFSSKLEEYIDIDTGPDGALYYVNFGGTIYRLSADTPEPSPVVSQRNLDLIEGNTRGLAVTLAQAPAAPVTVTVAWAGGDNDISVVAGETLTFTPDDWFVPQPVLVAAAEDADADWDTAFLEVSALGLASQYVNVLVGDNDLRTTDNPPTASISFPQEGDEISGTNAEFFGNGEDDVGTLWAEFYVDDKLEWVDLDNPKEPGHYHYGGGHNSWDTTIYVNGPHRLRLVVYDTLGQAGSSKEINVIVNNK